MLETILGRRSIRRYTPEPITPDAMEQILRAGMTAPSARNARPWQFVVVDDRGIMDAIRAVHPYASPLTTAAAAVVLCGDPDGDPRGHDEFWQQDCGACAENMLLAAHEMGLGGVWMGVWPNETIAGVLRQLLGIPEKVLPFCVLAFGHPAEEGSRPDRFEPWRIHRNKWEESSEGKDCKVE